MIARLPQKTIPIPEQFDRASDHGFLARHIELTDKLKTLIERPDAITDAGFTGRREEVLKNELFDQACEDTARSLLLGEESITSIAVKDAQNMVNQRYNQFLKNPELAGVSRASAVH